ncbi:sulfite oxidase [Actinocorallia longicatena]|uniref:Sulfite oxidase n=1 Tax=Actinocorallia longicatena TaxID=111803 RepID=A0ABP6QGM0_9ACTN
MDLTDEGVYERVRSAQRAELSRRGLLKTTAVAGAGAALAGGLTTRAAAAGPIVKPLPPEWFTVFGTNAETRWEALRGQGFLTPNERFFVRNHILTPQIDPASYRLRIWGSGVANELELSLDDLRAIKGESLVASVECTGNGRGFYASQQGQTVSGTAWKLGAVGVAHWRGVRLSALLERAGLTGGAVDLLPRGLDPDYVDKGVNLGRVRRPLPVAKALKDVLVAYEMNGEPLPPDHGFPVRLVVPGWVGIASVKWLGDIQVAEEPLFSPWNTTFYRMFGGDHPPGGGDPLTTMNVKSAFELPWNATLTAGRTEVLHGRSWSGAGRIARVEISTDGETWQDAVLDPSRSATAWQQWEYRWHRPAAGSYQLRARATDEHGTVQPETAPFNTLGYQFGAVVRHPVTVA